MHIYVPTTRWTISFVLIAFVQAIAALSIEGYVFGKFQTSLEDYDTSHSDPETRAIPTYIALLIFAFVYQLVLVYDALWRKNTIQVIGICMYNVGILVYTGIQIDQIRQVVEVLSSTGKISPGLWDDISGALIAVSVILGVCTVALALVAFKLYEVFAWEIYSQIKANYKMKRRLLIYHIYITLLKFDFFFFLGFTVQFLVVVVNTSNLEFILTVIAVPITIIILFLTAYWVRTEFTAGMIGTIVIWFSSLAYFLFKLVRMYAAPPDRITDYLPVRKSLTVFAALTLALLVTTIIVAIICTLNFHKGLKLLLQRSPSLTDTEGLVANSYDLNQAGEKAPRMEMD